MIEIVHSITFRKGIIFVRFVVDSVSKIPQYIIGRNPFLKQFLTFCQPRCKFRHILPPSLQTRERSAIEPSHASARRKRVWIWRVGIALQSQMRHTLRKMPIGNVSQFPKILLPRDSPSREALRRNAFLSIDMGSRCAGSDWLIGIAAHMPFFLGFVRKPEFAHGRIGIFPVFEQVAGDYIAERRFVQNTDSAFVRKLRHVSVIVFRDEIANRPAPIGENPFCRLGTVHDPSEKNR